MVLLSAYYDWDSYFAFLWRDISPLKSDNYSAKSENTITAYDRGDLYCK